MRLPRRRGDRRRAYLLIETAMAGVIVAVAMTMTVRLFAWTASERRSAERRGWAVQEAANAMERLAALPFDRLTADSARETARLSPEAAALLPSGKLAVAVREDSDVPGLKRVDVEVRWSGAGGIAETPVRLSSWVARKGAAKEATR